MRWAAAREAVTDRRKGPALIRTLLPALQAAGAVVAGLLQIRMALVAVAEAVVLVPAPEARGTI